MFQTMSQGVTVLVTVRGSQSVQRQTTESTEPLDGFVLPMIWRRPMWFLVAPHKNLPKPRVEDNNPLGLSRSYERHAGHRL
jgi:hypothetical protein